MRLTPMARVTVSTTGSPSGIAATASATAARKISAGGIPWSSPTTATSRESPTMATPISRPKRPSSPAAGCACARSRAPPWRCGPAPCAAPVRTTIPRPRPRVTTVPAKAMFVWSPGTSDSSPSASVALRTGTDSPVSADSSTSRSRTRTRRRSAGTRAPEASTTTSPGTRSRLGTSCVSPPRTTSARGALICASACIACCARRSCQKPMTAFSTTTARITPASAYSRSTSVTAAAMSRM
jgi:hypothetical protein